MSFHTKGRVDIGTVVSGIGCMEESFIVDYKGCNLKDNFAFKGKIWNKRTIFALYSLFVLQSDQKIPSIFDSSDISHTHPRLIIWVIFWTSVSFG